MNGVGVNSETHCQYALESNQRIMLIIISNMVQIFPGEEETLKSLLEAR